MVVSFLGDDLHGAGRLTPLGGVVGYPKLCLSNAAAHLNRRSHGDELLAEERHLHG